MYSSLLLSQMIKYMAFLLLEERPPFMKYVLYVTLNENFISATKGFQMSQELHDVVIFT